MLIIIGPPGSKGFDCQLPLAELFDAPTVLRYMADQIEANLREGML